MLASLQSQFLILVFQSIQQLRDLISCCVVWKLFFKRPSVVLQLNCYLCIGKELVDFVLKGVSVAAVMVVAVLVLYIYHIVLR